MLRIQLRPIFDKFDANSSGTVSTTELAEMCKAIGMNLTPEELQAIVNDADPDNSGEIDFNEFVATLVRQQKEAAANGGKPKADAATARANAACDVLELLMLRTHAVEGGGRGGRAFGGGAYDGGAYRGGAFGRGAGRPSGGERSAAWISQCEASLLTWVDTQKKLCAESDLRALQLDAQLRGERTDAAAALEQRPRPGRPVGT
ncbi:troponin c [Chrysochromulina tobinii]|uniref:Troponin c n=1 Tax=Chrysochromulina tobinii TaxID=1460289 RepID=A0A0M0J458_9EUKA|nr:troponin c [Chrysochromulina tobinii]|eukprot:KOO21122.1 troponin c [Chrysochromulina sp. CCMP291]